MVELLNFMAEFKNGILKCSFIRTALYYILMVIVTLWGTIKPIIAKIFNNLVFILIFIAYFFYYFFVVTPVIFNPNATELATFFSSILIREPNDLLVESFLKNSAVFSVTLIPLGLTFYYFYYREQKTTSESAVIRNGTRIPSICTLFTFITSAIFSSYLYLIMSTFSNSNVMSDNLNLTVMYFNKVIICLILFLIEVVLAVRMILTLLNNINISWLLKNNINEVKSEIIKLTLFADGKRFEAYRVDVYNKLHLLIESIYQMLNNTVNKNIDIVYNDRFKQLVSVLHFLNRLGKVSPTGELEIRYLHLLKYDPNCYQLLYRTIMKNHLLLIIALYNNNKLQEGALCVRYFLGLKPKAMFKMQIGKIEERIIAEYYSTFWDLLTFLLKVDDIGFRKLLSRLKPCLLNDAEMISMLGVFKALIVKAISKNDVRLLTELCYSVQNLADYSDKNNPSKIKREVADLNPYGIGMTEHITQMAFCSNSHYKGIALYVLLQAALKSIELGHYETTGFLIKYMVSNFDYNLIKRTFDKLLKVNGIDDEYLNKGELFDRINVSFNINDKTSKYCLQKLTILLYLQQNFYNEYICDDLANKEQHINICILTNCKIVDYLFSKILLAGNKYGLLCLNNEEFYKRTKAELVKRITSMQQSMDKLKRNFEQHNMAVFQVSNSQELLDLLNEFIKDNTTVGCGDSVTLEQTGVFDYLRKRDITFLDKYQPSLSHEDKRAIYLRNFTADNFITGSNAITMDGKIFNIDGNGSRVAPMIYGPEQVIIVVGTNKITENVDEAIKRVRQIAAPLDAKRLGKGTPCTKLGCCIDCSHKERICNDFVLIANQFVKDRIKIIIIDQGLGY